MNDVLAQSEISEIEIAPDKITLIRYNPKTTDCGELANALLASKLPKGKHTLILPDDIEISQMSPEEAERIAVSIRRGKARACDDRRVKNMIGFWKKHDPFSTIISKSEKYEAEYKKICQKAISERYNREFEKLGLDYRVSEKKINVSIYLEYTRKWYGISLECLGISKKQFDTPISFQKGDIIVYGKTTYFSERQLENINLSKTFYIIDNFNNYHIYIDNLPEELSGPLQSMYSSDLIKISKKIIRKKHICKKII